MSHDDQLCTLRAAEHVLVKRLPAATDPTKRSELLELALVTIEAATEEWELVKQHAELGVLSPAALVHAYAMRLLCLTEAVGLYGKIDDPVQRDECQQLRKELANIARDGLDSELLEVIDRRLTDVFGSID